MGRLIAKIAMCKRISRCFPADASKAGIPRLYLTCGHLLRATPRSEGAQQASKLSVIFDVRRVLNFASRSKLSVTRALLPGDDYRRYPLNQGGRKRVVRHLRKCPLRHVWRFKPTGRSLLTGTYRNRKNIGPCPQRPARVLQDSSHRRRYRGRGNSADDDRGCRPERRRRSGRRRQVRRRPGGQQEDRQVRGPEEESALRRV